MNEPFAYDQVEYPSLIHPQMHPSRLAAIARLHGIRAAAPGSCRLLEVGCGDGLQLITLIASARAQVEGAGIPNVTLLQGDVGTLPSRVGAFDVIVAHGFYSWVPEPVRQRLLRLCDMHLGPRGIAYVSYNALPGSHLRRMLWEILQFHAGTDRNPATSVPRARECLDLLLLGMPDNTRYRTTLAGEIADLKARLNPQVLFHDDLAPINDPCTLDQFTRTRMHGPCWKRWRKTTS